MVDKITSPVGANELILKVNSVIDAIPTSTTQLTNDSGFITGITSSMITDALTYTPYDASNPEGFISSAALTSLTDTTISNPAAGQGLIYDASSGTWKNGNISSSVPWGNITGTLADQTDLNEALGGKQATITGAASSITSSNLTANRALISNSSGKVAVSSITSTKLGYLTDVTSNIQAQINGVSSAIPTSTTQLTNDSGYITGITSSMVTTALGFTPESTSNKTTVIASSSTDTQYPSAKAVYTATNANASAISTINDKIPSQATSSNQLADKAFVNSSISTNTANFIGTFQSVAELEAYSGTKTNNDYAFVETTDTAGNTFYDRYKYNSTTQEWIFEYELNNSSFTAAQWAAINSGCTTTTASLAASALQSGDNISLLNNNAGYITGINSSDVTTALGYTPAGNSDVVHLAGTETITGEKKFRVTPYVWSSAQNAWDPIIGSVQISNYFANKTLSNLGATSSTNFDGQWNYTFNQIHSALNLGTYTYYLNATKGQEAGASSSNIFDILPDDDYKYELLIMADGRIKATTASHINIATTAWANPLDTEHNLLAMRGDGSHSLYNNNSLVIPIDTDRKIQVAIINTKPDLANVTIFGYRRIGTNL